MIDLSAWLSRFADWWRRTVWDFPRRETSWVRDVVFIYVRAWENAVRSYEPDLIAMRAHALTFRTLLSVIPLLAVAFSLFKAFGGLEASQRLLQQKLLENLAPGTASLVQDYTSTYLTRVSAGAIGGVGVVVLFLTVVSLLTYIEKAFNALWNVEKVRPFFHRFVIYWTLVTVGPVLVALSFSLTSPGRSSVLVARATEWGMNPILQVTLSQLHWLFAWVGMTLLFVIVPNTRVSWRAAVGGGLLAGMLWEVGKLGFTWVSARLFNYSAVYGSLGTLPVFLLWLQIGWLIVLFGCKVTYGLQYSRALQEERAALGAGPVAREQLALRSMVAVAQAYLKGAPPPTAEKLATGSRAPFEVHQEVLNRLVEARLLLAVSGDGSWDADEGGRSNERNVERYLTARKASLITLDEIIRVFRGRGVSQTEDPAGDAVTSFVEQVLERADTAATAVTGGISLAEAVRRVEDP